MRELLLMNAIVSCEKDLFLLLTQFVDSHKINEELSVLCHSKIGNKKILNTSDDSVVNMALACMLYGIGRYSESAAMAHKVLSYCESRENAPYFEAMSVLEILALLGASQLGQAMDILEAKKCYTHLTLPTLPLLACKISRLHGTLVATASHAHIVEEFFPDTQQAMEANLLVELATVDRTGDMSHFSTRISHHYFNLLDRSMFNPECISSAVQFGAHLSFSYFMQGSISMARMVLKDIALRFPDYTCQMLRQSQTIEAALSQKNTEVDTLSGANALRDRGASRQELIDIKRTNLYALHILERNREGLSASKQLYEYVLSISDVINHDATCLLHASFLLSLYDFGGVERLLCEAFPLGKKGISQIGERAMFCCIEALVALRQKDMRHAVSIINESKNDITSQNSQLYVGMLCCLHKSLFTVLCTALTIDFLPEPIIEILDTGRFRGHLLQAYDAISHSEKLKLTDRLTHTFLGSDRIVAKEKDSVIDIRVFGMLEISNCETDERVARWAKSKSRQMFLRVVLEYMSEVDRTTMNHLLWPDRLDHVATNNFYVTLAAMRKILQNVTGKSEQQIVEKAMGGRLGLNLRFCSLDLEHFDKTLLNVRSNLLANDFRGALKEYYLLCSLYRGDLLPGDDTFDWIKPYRDRYRKLFIDNMVSASKLCLDIGAFEDAHNFIDSAMRVEPSREILYEMSLIAYKQMNRRDDALKVYYDYVSYLKEELGLDPSQRLMTLFEELLNET